MQATLKQLQETQHTSSNPWPWSHPWSPPSSPSPPKIPMLRISTTAPCCCYWAVVGLSQTWLSPSLLLGQTCSGTSQSWSKQRWRRHSEPQAEMGKRKGEGVFMAGLSTVDGLGLITSQNKEWLERAGGIWERGETERVQPHGLSIWLPLQPQQEPTNLSKS